MRPFALTEPTSLEEAIALLDPADPSVRAISGGTGLMLMMKTGAFRPTRLVSLRRIAGGIAADADGTLHIGATTTLATLERSADVRRLAPMIVDAMPRLANVRVRNVATVGGSLAHGDPHMDLPPVLIALRAQVIAVGPNGPRTIPVQELYTGYYTTVLAPDELIAEVIVPPQDRILTAYMKCTTRAAHDWPAVGVAVALPPYGDSPCVVVSAVTETPVRILEAEVIIMGIRDELSVACAAEAAAQVVKVESDARGSAAYKRQLVRVYVTRAINAAIASGPEA